MKVKNHQIVLTWVFIGAKYKRITCSYERNIGLTFRSLEIELFAFRFESTLTTENTIEAYAESCVSGS